jgi:anti-sigma factor RsiW
MTHQQALDGLASERYLLDEMNEGERFEFEAHYFDCTECAEDVKRGEMIRQEARQAGFRTGGRVETGQPGVVLTSPKWWRRPMVAVPWAAAATLALVTGYQSFVTVPGLREAVAPQAIEPVMLRGATRGATHSLVTIAPNQRFVALSADLTTTPESSALTYEILDANRRSIVSGQSATPSAGAPLMLLVPVHELQNAGHYTLAVRQADQKTVIGEYEFDVSY